MVSNPNNILNQIQVFYDEISSTSGDSKLNVHDLPHVSSVMARWEGIRDEVAALTFGLERQHLTAKIDIDGKMRESKAKQGTLGTGATYDERVAVWETKHIEAYKTFQALDFVLDSLKDLYWHLDRRIKWLNGLLIEARELDKRAFYQSSKDVFTVD